MKKTKFIAIILAVLLTISPEIFMSVYTPDNIISVSAAETYGDYEYNVLKDSKGSYVEITKYTGSESTVVIPSKINSLPVKSIGELAFGTDNPYVLWSNGYPNIKKVVIPEGVTTIKYFAFRGCRALTSVNLPESLETLGQGAFCICTSLESITIPKNVKNYGGSEFGYCYELKTVVIENGVTEIPQKMFYKCSSLNNITIPNTVKKIGDNAFELCENLPEITIPNSVEEIGTSVFLDCESLKKVTLSDNINQIYSGTFNNCTSLKEITLPYYTSKISSGAFTGTNLEIINIGPKLKSLENLPINNSTIKEINVSEDNNYYSSENGIIFNKDKSKLIRFPAAMEKNDYSIPDTVSTIGESSFADNMSIRNIYLSKNCSNIEPYAFKNCTHLDKIYFYNKNCDIYMSTDTIFEDALINGYTGSTAEEYANIYDRAFNAITTTTLTTTSTTTTTKKTTTTTTTTTQKELKLSTDKITLKAGEQYNISANQTNLTYSSSDRSIAIVSSNGVITALNDGEATISVFNSNYDVAQIKVTVRSVTSGDVNGDNVLSIADAVMLQKYLLGSGTLTNWKNADLCKDDRIDVFDMVLMRKLLIENN